MCQGMGRNGKSKELEKRKETNEVRARDRSKSYQESAEIF